jgi:hypothetical protein
MKHRRRKGIRGLIVALATAVILVPAANAKTYEGGSAGYVTTDAQAQSYSPQALKAMVDRWNARADSYADSFRRSRDDAYTLRPDDRAGARGIGTVTAPDYVDRQLANLQAKAALVAQSFHVDDRAGIHGPGPIETPAVVSSHGDGFDWTDAGIGASIALVAAMMLGAVALMRRRSTGLAA